MNIIANILRGALIGMAELVPGISGGTIALVTGVYERILTQANHFLDGIKLLLKDKNAGLAQLKRVDWLLLIPLAVGMALVVVTMAGVMESFVTDQPIASRALFFGMVLASLIVPLGMIDKTQLRSRIALCVPAFIIAALATFFLTGVTSAPQEDPNLLIVFFAAATAVCALVLPGVSGSFFLLAVGLYSATMGAVHERELGYLTVFALGALTGIILFVRTLQMLLSKHRTLTLVVMSGLMLGSLRALWPWQNDDASLLAPDHNVGIAVTLFIVGAVAVVAMIVAEKKFSSGASEHSSSVSEH